MVSTFTPNIQIEEPARGDDVGTWDTPVNNTSTLLDLTIGAINTIGLNNSNVVLSAAQFRSKQLTFNSTLTGSVTITFPTSFIKSYEVQHLCTGSSAFTITLATTAAAGQAIAIPPGEIIDCVNDGTNIKFKNLGRIGSHWDYAGSSVPAWVSGCTVPPYLNEDGSTFSATTYPALAIILGSTTLPNSKGKSRFASDQGAGLISSAVGGFSGTGVGATGGGMTTTLGTSNLPPYTPSGGISLPTPLWTQTGPNDVGAGANFNMTNAGAPVFVGNPQGGVSQVMTNLPPAYIGGLTLIRAG